MQVLDKGILELKQATQQMDYSVLAAARVSNGGIFEEASKGEEQDQKLINYLMKHKHGTPFEHNLFTFYVKCPLFVRSEWHRHRVAWSYNEVSRRYVDTEPEFYIPDIFRVPGTTNKQGSVIPELESTIAKTKQHIWTALTKQHCDASLMLYNEYLEQGMAKELARMVLPQNMYTEFYATCNARSLMHFLNLRTAETAQQEIRMYALAMESVFKDQMPMTYKAWAQNERVSP